MKAKMSADRTALLVGLLVVVAVAAAAATGSPLADATAEKHINNKHHPHKRDGFKILESDSDDRRLGGNSKSKTKKSKKKKKSLFKSEKKKSDSDIKSRKKSDKRSDKSKKKSDDDSDDSDDEMISVTVSYQPALYWALPIYLSDTLGYFTDLGLDVSFKTYPSGAPQIEDAIDSEAWDVGASGTVPCILGGLDGDIMTVGISNDESAANAMIANRDGVDSWPPDDIEDVDFAITPNSTGQYSVVECLKAEGFDVDWDADNFIYGSQTEVKEALSSGDASYGSFWAPNTYDFLENNRGSEMICNGKDVGATIPGGIIVRTDYADENPDVVAKVLAAWVRGIGYMLNPDNRDDAIDHLADFYALNDVVISQEAMEAEFDTRPIFDLQGQLDIMERKGGRASTLDEMFNGAAEFMEEQGVVDKAPDPEDYITDMYMQMVYDDEMLRKFTMMNSGDSDDDSDDTGSDDNDSEDDNGDSDDENTCPPSGGADCEFEPTNTFNCGDNLQCSYRTICDLEAADFDRDDDCCQAPPLDSTCPFLLDPVICGDRKCPYDNLCLATLSGYDEDQCESAEEDRTVMDIIEDSIYLTTLEAALKLTGLDDTLRGDGPYSIFSPTDDAFKGLSEGVLDDLLLEENRDQLENILLYHVALDDPAIFSGDLSHRQKIEMAQGDTTRIRINDVNGKVRVNNANIIEADVAASNGVIHAIDKVLIPPAADEGTDGSKPKDSESKKTKKSSKKKKKKRSSSSSSSRSDKRSKCRSRRKDCKQSCKSSHSGGSRRKKCYGKCIVSYRSCY